MSTTDQPIDRDEVADVLEKTRAAGIGRRVLLAGPRDVGKTYEAVQSADETQRVICVSAHADMPVFAGADRSEFGKLLEGAWTKGGLVVINAAELLSQDDMSNLMWLLDSVSRSRTTMFSDQPQPMHPRFRIIATCVDAAALPGAVRDKFDMVIGLDRPSTAMLQQLDADIAAAVTESYQEVADGVTTSPYLTYRQGSALSDMCRRISNRSFSELVTTLYGPDDPRSDRLIAALGPNGPEGLQR